MKELKIGEVFLFLGTQYIVCGYNSVEGVIESIDIWPFLGKADDFEGIQRALVESINGKHRVNS